MLNDILFGFTHLLQLPLFWVILLLLITIMSFIFSRVRLDVIALMVLLVFSLTGILTISEVFAGFSDLNIILIALLFVIGEGLVRTGIAYKVSEWIITTAKNSEAKVLVLLMLAVAGLGAFMSSTGVVAIFIPVALSICQKMHISASRLMMPLSVAGLISGMLTLIATPPNLIEHADLLQIGNPGFSFFDFTPVGLIVLLLGIAYMSNMVEK